MAKTTFNLKSLALGSYVIALLAFFFVGAMAMATYWVAEPELGPSLSWLVVAGEMVLFAGAYWLGAVVVRRRYFHTHQTSQSFGTQSH